MCLLISQEVFYISEVRSRSTSRFYHLGNPKGKNRGEKLCVIRVAGHTLKLLVVIKREGLVVGDALGRPLFLASSTGGGSRERREVPCGVLV